jgi:hypothetical protein
MRVSGRLAVAALAVLAILGGCLGLGGEDEQLREDEVTTTADTGALEGLVTDPAVRPVTGADVTLVDAERSTTTGEDGSFSFSTVEPGEHTVRVDADGFLATEETVSVRADEVAQVDVVLADEVDEEPYMQQLELQGFIECGVGWRQDVASTGEPLVDDSALAACAVPNTVLPGENTTNDRFLHTFQLDPPLTEAVYELTWDAGGPDATSPALRSILELEGFINENGSRIMDVRGQDPLHVVLEEDDWEGLIANATERCDDGSDDWCQVSTRADGWDLALRVFATGDCLQASPVGSCLVLQQEFTHLVSAFYHQQAPQGYRLVDG